MNPEVFKLLSAVDWGATGKQLLAYTARKLRFYPWQSGGIHELAKGLTPEDIVEEVIQKAFSGERQWDPSKGELDPWLRRQVDSIISHLFESATNQREIRITNDSTGIEDITEGILGDYPPYINTTPEDDILYSEENALIRGQIDELIDLIADDDDLQSIIFAILDGCEPRPRFLAEFLGIEISDVNNRLKRLRRHAAKVRVKYEKQ